MISFTYFYILFLARETEFFLLYRHIAISRVCILYHLKFRFSPFYTITSWQPRFREIAAFYLLLAGVLFVFYKKRNASLYLALKFSLGVSYRAIQKKLTSSLESIEEVNSVMRRSFQVINIKFPRLEFYFVFVSLHTPKIHKEIIARRNDSCITKCEE